MSEFRVYETTIKVDQCAPHAAGVVLRCSTLDSQAFGDTGLSRIILNVPFSRVSSRRARMELMLAEKGDSLRVKFGTSLHEKGVVEVEQLYVLENVRWPDCMPAPAMSIDATPAAALPD